MKMLGICANAGAANVIPIGRMNWGHNVRVTARGPGHARAMTAPQIVMRLNMLCEQTFSGLARFRKSASLSISQRGVPQEF
jgi:hypothetical protein